jgi:hypothetical protein
LAGLNTADGGIPDLSAATDARRDSNGDFVSRGSPMRSVLSSTLVLSTLALFPGTSRASDRLPQIEVLKKDKSASVNAADLAYRGYVVHLSDIAGRKDYSEIVSALQHQVDMVENAGLSPRVLRFFRSIPVVTDEMSCLANEVSAVACYEPNGIPTYGAYVVRAKRVWNSENSQWTNANSAYFGSDSGVVMVRPLLTSEEQNPVMLHELLHAFHAQIMPQGFQNEGVLFHYNLAKTNKLYPEDKYLMKNEREFFAVTASIFLHGKDTAHDPFTRANLKEKQPAYYKYLVGLFEFDPESVPSASPVASAF